VDVKNLKRAELFNELILLAKKVHMKITRESQEVEIDLAKLRKSKRGSKKKNIPTNDELRAELTEWLKEHPGNQIGELQKLFDTLGWELIWTPPYTPTVQPIELCWAYCKGIVAQLFFTGRNIQQTREALFDAFYGNNAGKEGYTPDLARRHINHCHDWCNSYIADDEVLSGTIDNLSASAASSSTSSSSSSSSSATPPRAPLDSAPSDISSASVASSSSDQHLLPTRSFAEVVQSVSASRMLDFDDSKVDEEQESEAEEDDFFQDDSFDANDVYFGGANMSDDESDDEFND